MAVRNIHFVQALWHLGDIPISLNADCSNANCNAVYSPELGANAHPTKPQCKKTKIYKPGKI